MRGRKRLLSRPVNKKEPITVDILEKIVDLYGTNLQNVSDLRICILCLMGFSGFFRCSELAEIRLRNLVFTNTHVEVKLNKSKTDIYRKGSSVLIAKTGNKLCPVTWLSRYIEATKLTPGSEDFFLLQYSFAGSRELIRPKISVPHCHT